ncbi:hypothetical protein BLNAU_6577 [Blattamonas nauphoetae]|uniref:Uncharacterized protein n=1 Tax=Blattamonas nauphoetae TaxID=2049346 RepID=A0ABQ9Y472_9EUKA|nr:hypothetical protein BLNAU_6577 [Blattamonas nauphoetae]
MTSSSTENCINDHFELRADEALFIRNIVSTVGFPESFVDEMNRDPTKQSVLMNGLQMLYSSLPTSIQNDLSKDPEAPS